MDNAITIYWILFLIGLGYALFSGILTGFGEAAVGGGRQKLLWIKNKK